MNAQLTEIMRLITNLIRTGTVTEVDRENWLCRVKVGELETNWINWLTLRAGCARTWWCPSPDEQVVVLSMGGNLETAFALPAIYSSQFAAVMESDDALRLRVPAAFEGLSVAGPTAAYEFHARSADGRVADASATSPAPADVVLTVLSREEDGTADNDLLAVVEKALNSESVRPVADRLTVRSAEIIPYSVEATVFLYPGPEAEPVMAAAKASLQKYIASQTRLGRDIRRSALYAALHVEGVQRVELVSPLNDVVLDKTQAASCTQWNVTNGGTDE